MLELKSGVELKARYVVHGEVGTGGYATVWQASDKQLNRPVALKRLLKQSHIAAGTDVAALLQEAQKNAQLVHSNIVQVHDIIEIDGEHLIVMEYVDGQSLEALLRDRALRGELLPLDTGVAIIHDTLAGVDFAHSKSICHRDLSPANILLTSSGTPKVGDFGIAKVVTAASGGATVGGSQAGTGNASYMSPEQARGEPADFASDLFMVGIIGYMILTGRHPFAHPSGLFTIPELLVKEDFNPEAPRPAGNLSAVQQRLFREYAAVVMRLLQREKAGRFASAREAIDAIEEVTPTIDCPKCEERVPDHHNFCGLCGASLGRAESKPAPIVAKIDDIENADDLVERGYRLSLARRWDAAIQAYKQAIASEPQHKKAFRNLAFALNRIGRHEDALATVDAGLKLGELQPEHRASILYERSLALQSLRRYDDALTSVQEALSLQPDTPRFLYLRAKTHEFLGAFDAARRDAQAVLRRIPDHAGALRLMEQHAASSRQAAGERMLSLSMDRR